MRAEIPYPHGYLHGCPAGVTFRWPDTDAYRKLTRQHYGAVSVIPLPPSQRFRVTEGVYAPERKRDGTSWRWLGAGSMPWSHLRTDDCWRWPAASSGISKH